MIVAHGDKNWGFGAEDTALALSYLELYAPTLGLGTCWAGYFYSAVNAYPPLAQALQLPAKHKAFGAVMVFVSRRTDHVSLWLSGFLACVAMLGYALYAEKVLHLEISLGYQHRGIEPALIGGPTKRTLPYMETLAGDTTIGHSLAYCQAVESLLHLEVPRRGRYLRSLFLELERLHAHLRQHERAGDHPAE